MSTSRPAVPVRCAHCGEELLGAANRCWQCQQPINASHYPIPARRRPPLPEVRPTSSPFAALATAAEAANEAPAATPPEIPESMAADGMQSPGSQGAITASVVLIAATVLCLANWPQVSLLTALAAVGLTIRQLRTPFFRGACFLLAVSCLLLGTATFWILWRS